VILMRKDPTLRYRVHLHHVYPGLRAEPRALVCNRPQGLRDMNEKVYTARFPECCAPTSITRDMHDMSEIPARTRQGGVQTLGCMGRQVDFRPGTRRTRTATSCSRPSPAMARGMPSSNGICRRSSAPAIADHSSGRRARSLCLATNPTAEDNRGNLAPGPEPRAAAQRP